MERFVEAVRRHRRPAILIAAGLVILLLHGVMYTTVETGLGNIDMSAAPGEWEQYQVDEDGFTRLMAAGTVFPPIGQALLIAGLLGWMLEAQRDGRDRD
ncbi:hypothetical protein [Streptomyces sp. NBC_00057]|uniref:hypothetical protein n=1 Tax=Streptomyces sp. NBC_00057 TaxID=2975634 RepID=UPI0032495B73